MLLTQRTARAGLPGHLPLKRLNGNQWPIQPVARRQIRQCRSAIRASLGNKGQVYVPAANGLLAARIIKQLLQAGCKVTAGVPDVDEAKQFVSLAQKLEVLPSAALKSLSFVEVQPADAESIIDGMPKRGARAVVVMGDSVEGRRPDARTGERVLGALLDEEAPALEQLLLVVPRGGAGGGGGFLGFVGGGGSGSARLSKVEQAILDNGVSAAIVRVGSSDNVDPAYAEVAGLVVGGFGSVPAQLKMTTGQAAAVAAAVFLQTPGACIVEAAADVDAELVDADTAVMSILSEAVLQEEIVEEEEQEEEDKEEVSAVSAKPSFGFGGLKLPSIGNSTGRKVEEEAQQEEDEEVEKVVTPRKSQTGFGFGTFKLALPGNKVDAADPEEDEEAPVSSSRSTSRGSAASSPRGNTQKQAVAVATEDEAASKKGGLLSALGFGQPSVYVDEIKN